MPPFEDSSAPPRSSNPEADPFSSHLAFPTNPRKHKYAYMTIGRAVTPIGAHASLSRLALWSNGSGTKIPTSKPPRASQHVEERDLDPKKQEGGAFDNSTHADDEAHPRLCSGPGPAAGERGCEQVTERRGGGGKKGVTR